jgi:hypothetical protein
MATKTATKPTSKPEAKKQVMQIYRASDRRPSETDASSEKIQPMSPETQAGFARLVEAGVMDGAMVKTLFDIPGFKLTYCWFKAHYPLPRHSHKQDCLYYIVKGDIKLGTERLGPGDGFFLPDGTPYTYDIGAEGAEVLEIRTNGDTDFRAFNYSAKWWDKAEKACRDNHEAWVKAEPPRPARSA